MATSTFSNLIMRDSDKTIGVAIFERDPQTACDLAAHHLHIQAGARALAAGAIGYEFDADLTPRPVILPDREWDAHVTKYQVQINTTVRFIFAS